MVTMDAFASAFGFDAKSDDVWTTLGKVTAVGSGTLSVLLGGSATPTECEAYCVAGVGDIVFVAITKGRARAIACKGGGGFGGILPIENGGTGASTVAGALENLGIDGLEGEIGDLGDRVDAAETDIIKLFYPQVSEAIQETDIDVGNWSRFKGFHVGGLYVGIYFDSWNKFKDSNGNYIDSTTSTGSMYLSDDYLSRPLPCPVEAGSYAMFGSTYWGSYTQRFATLAISTLDRPDSTYEYGSQVRFKMGSSVTIDNNASFDFAIRLLVVAKRANIRQSPRIAYSNSRSASVLSCAQTYLAARVDGLRSFAYGRNWADEGRDALNNAQGEGLGECDTLAFLSASGVTYANSPYASNTTPNATYDRANLTYPNDTWAKNQQQLGTWVSYLSAQAWYFIYNNLAFSDIEQVSDGDFVLFRGGEGSPNAKNNFDSVSHIGIVYRDGGKLRMIHWTSGNDRDPEGYKIRDDDFEQFLESVQRNAYTEPDSYYFARLPLN